MYNEAQDMQLEDLETNCDQCVLNKEELCPYLETIVNCHLFNDLRTLEVSNRFKNERRQYPRMITSIPVFISNDSSGEEKIRIGSIIDISLGGVRISIPRTAKHGALTSSQITQFQIIAEFPDENKPINLKCKPQRLVQFEDNIHVGASIIDADLRSLSKTRW